MRHLFFLVFLTLYVVIGGQNWHQYSAVLMAVAWFRYGGRLDHRLW